MFVFTLNLHVIILLFSNLVIAIKSLCFTFFDSVYCATVSVPILYCLYMHVINCDALNDVNIIHVAVYSLCLFHLFRERTFGGVCDRFVEIPRKMCNCVVLVVTAIFLG